MNRTHNLLGGSFLALCPLLTAPLGAQIVKQVFEEYLTFEGAAAGDLLGMSFAGVGDLNGDGYGDVIVGAPGARPGGRINAGSAYIYSGKDGAMLWQFDGAAAWDMLGTSVAGAGDVNGDGFDDVIVGVPAPFDGAGSAYVYSGRNWALLRRFDGTVFRGRFGTSVAGAGDVNGDGLSDVIVGKSWGAWAVGLPTTGSIGSVYVYSGRDGHLTWSVDGRWAYDGMGTSIAGAGDVDQDGFDDVIVGLPRLTSVVAQNYVRSIVSVYSGKDGSSLWRVSGKDGDYLGGSVAAAGDVDGDGYPDVITGWASHPWLRFEGFAVVYSGRNGNKLRQFPGSYVESVAGAGDVNQDGFADVIVGAANAAVVYSGKDGSKLSRIAGAEAGNWFGYSVSGAGDVNGDGIPDVIVGAHDADPGGRDSAGFVSVYVLKPAAVTYGTGVPGSGGITPNIRPGSELPRIGSSNFEITVGSTVGVAPCVIAGSVRQARTLLAGLTLYGDFSTPGEFMTWGLVTSGIRGLRGTGRATLSIQIPNDPSLVGYETFWQGFVFDSGSPLPIGLAHTDGLQVIVIR